MRQPVQLLNPTPSEDERESGLYLSKAAIMPSQGFTAVNGLDKRRTTSLPDSMPNKAQDGRVSGPNTSDADKDETHDRRLSHRNDSVLCSEPTIKRSPGTAKRKRSVAESIERPQLNDSSLSGEHSSKRHMAGGEPKSRSRSPRTINSAIADEARLLSTQIALERISRNQCSREQSPIPTHDQRVAPPQVRPETEAHLAESLAIHLQNAYRNAPSTLDTEQATFEPDASPQEAQSPGDVGADSSGKGKRKFSNRTKTGCHTCRERKKKCDEEKPICKNCMKGGFLCKGYGPKPLGYKGPQPSSRNHVPLQSKLQDSPIESLATFTSDGPRYSHWGRVPPTPTSEDSYHRFPPAYGPHEARSSISREGWPDHTWQHRQEGPYAASALPSIHDGQPIHRAPAYPGEHLPPHEGWPRPYLPSYQSYSGPGTTISSRESVTTHSSRSKALPYMTTSQPSEKEKMLLGKPYHAHLDDTLREERQQCQAAVDRFNQANSHTRATSKAEISRLFLAILDPQQRSEYRDYHPGSPPHSRPRRIGHTAIIEPPFFCDYGYNITIGDEVVISANCQMEDPCDIIIGSKVFVGKNVHFCGNAPSDEPHSRMGSKGLMVGGAIEVEDDVYIGPGTIIMPHRTIGRGARVGPGSVVTEDIPPYTEAAGNPARVVRSLPRPDEPADAKLALDKVIADQNAQSLRRMSARRAAR